MGGNLNKVERLTCWFLFDILMMVPVIIFIPLYLSFRYFPARTLSPRGIQDILEYFIFVLVAAPFGLVGQLLEIMFEVHWHPSALEELWEKWYRIAYIPDCYVNGEDPFCNTVPKEKDMYAEFAVPQASTKRA